MWEGGELDDIKLSRRLAVEALGFVSEHLKSRIFHGQLARQQPSSKSLQPAFLLLCQEALMGIQDVASSEALQAASLSTGVVERVKVVWGEVLELVHELVTVPCFVTIIQVRRQMGLALSHSRSCHASGAQTWMSVCWLWLGRSFWFTRMIDCGVRRSRCSMHA